MPETTGRSGAAPAKINLTLHVTGQRADGYHSLDSLVAFADLSDTLTVAPGADLSLTVDGPFKQGVPVNRRNLILRAAESLRRARGVTAGARLGLTKSLPHAAGIGSASSDAATAIRLLASLWDVAPFDPADPEVIALGGDVPVCLAGPTPHWMRGIGEIVAPAPPLPAMALVLVNPGVGLATSATFAALAAKNGAPVPDIGPALDLAGFCDWLALCRNDLETPAISLAPEIGGVLEKLRGFAQVRHAAMSGSGSTCFAIVADMATARQVARAIQIAQMGWWVAPAAVLS